MRDAWPAIEAGKLYDVATVARILGSTPELFKKHWVDTGRCRVIKWGNQCSIFGDAVLTAFEAQQQCKTRKQAHGSRSSQPAAATVTCSAGETQKPVDGVKGRPVQRVGHKRAAKQQASSSS